MECNGGFVNNHRWQGLVIAELLLIIQVDAVAHPPIINKKVNIIIEKFGNPDGL